MSLAVALPSFAEKRVTVGVVTDGASPQSDTIRAVFLEELSALTEQEFKIESPAGKQWNGQWTPSGIAAALDQAGKDREVDIVLVLGFAASQQVALRKNFRKPTFAPFVINVLGGRLPHKGPASGIPNFNYLTVDAQWTDLLKSFRTVAPFKRAALLLDETLFQTIQDTFKDLKDKSQKMGVDLQAVLHAGEKDLVSKIPADADAVIVAALPRLSGDDRRALVAGLLQRKLPSFSVGGDAGVAEGLLASNISSVDISHRARQTALNVHAVLRGERAGDQPVVFERKAQLTINMATARAIGVAPRFEVMRSAVLLNEDPDMTGAPLTISHAAQEAVRVNLDVIAGQLGVRAGQSEVARVRSVLFPQLTGSLDYAARKDDYPYITSGLLAKNSAAASLKLNQILFSESALADLSVQKKLQIAQQAQQRTLEMDIVQQAVTGYLAVLTTESILKVQRDGVRLAQENLQQAKSRVAAGKADASDVARWESEIADARQKVLFARTQVEQSRDRLNRLLHRPLADRYPLQPAVLEDPQLLIGQPEFLATVDNDRAFQRVMDFFIREGLTASPDLAELDARVRAQERQFKSDQVGSFAPNLSLTGDGYRVLDETRLASSTLQLEDKSYWALGLNLSLPILEGGGRLATISRSRHTLDQLRTQRDALRLSIEQSVRDNLHALQASYPSIRLSQESAEASRRNYSLVSRNYARGTRSIVDLLDAQNNSLAADQSAANAVYIALTHLMNLQRSIGGSTYLSTPEQMDDLMKRLKSYLDAAGTPKEQKT